MPALKQCFITLQPKPIPTKEIVWNLNNCLLDKIKANSFPLHALYNGEPDWETRMMLQDKSISDYLNWKKPNIYKKKVKYKIIDL